MTKTITITDPRQVKAGDKAYFKGCGFGFDVIGVDADDEDSPIVVYNPLSGFNYWASSSRFDHATREGREPEWPHPGDIDMHVYLGSDGKKYLYMPGYDCDSFPWRRLPNDDWSDAEEMTERYPDALPMTELKLVPEDEES